MILVSWYSEGDPFYVFSFAKLYKCILFGENLYLYVILSSLASSVSAHHKFSATRTHCLRSSDQPQKSQEHKTVLSKTANKEIMTMPLLATDAKSFVVHTASGSPVMVAGEVHIKSELDVYIKMVCVSMMVLLFIQVLVGCCQVRQVGWFICRGYCYMVNEGSIVVFGGYYT